MANVVCVVQCGSGGVVTILLVGSAAKTSDNPKVSALGSIWHARHFVLGTRYGLSFINQYSCALALACRMLEFVDEYGCIYTVTVTAGSLLTLTHVSQNYSAAHCI